MDVHVKEAANKVFEGMGAHSVTAKILAPNEGINPGYPRGLWARSVAKYRGVADGIPDESPYTPHCTNSRFIFSRY